MSEHATPTANAAAPQPADGQDLVTIRSAKDGSRAMWSAFAPPAEGCEAAMTLGFRGAAGRELLACWRKAHAASAQDGLHRAHWTLTKHRDLAPQGVFELPPNVAPRAAALGAAFALIEPSPWPYAPQDFRGPDADAPPLWLVPLHPSERQWIQSGASVEAFLERARAASADLWDWARPPIDLGPAPV